VTIRVADFGAAERFYEVTLAAAGIAPPTRRVGYTQWGDFLVSHARDDRPPARGLHVGFAAGSRELVDAFWDAGRSAGYADDGAPGERPEYSPSYYGAFLRDPDGNSAEAVHRDGGRTDGTVDHVWIRVADLAASRRFYDTIAPAAGLRAGEEHEDRVAYVSERPGGGDFSIVAGPPTEHVHLAFPADDDALVQRFHADATGEGFRDNGGPGERPEYHPGYYAAFVLDPDGNNIEVVNHHRT
jgi:catechol 2,3-dioxygenase-like lactoylglutathione lyase family enzyme